MLWVHYVYSVGSLRPRITRIACIRHKGQTQYIFPRSQYTCLYLYWPKVNFIYQVVFGLQLAWTLFTSLAQLFCKCFFFKKRPPVAISDVQKSLLTISDQYHHLYVCDLFYKMAAGGHFGCPKLTFDGISGHFRSIQNFFFKTFIQNGRRRPFWMSEIHFWTHFWPFQIDMQL